MSHELMTLSAGRQILLLGGNEFVLGRLSRILIAGGFSLCRDRNANEGCKFAVVAEPNGDEIASLYTQGVRLIGVCSEREYPGQNKVWPFEGWIHELMSAEAILHIINDVIYREVGARQHQRLPVALEILVCGLDRILNTTTADISHGGVFVRSLNPFPRGTKVHLHLIACSANGELLGNVLYLIKHTPERIVSEDDAERPVVAHPGMAIRFDEGQSDTIERWVQFARERLNQPNPSKKTLF
jgi:hypothetical protein